MLLATSTLAPLGQHEPDGRLYKGLDEPSVKQRRDGQMASNLWEARAATHLKAINTMIMFVSFEELGSIATFGAAPPSTECFVWMRPGVSETMKASVHRWRSTPHMCINKT